MTPRTPGRSRSWLAVRNLVPLCLLALFTAPIPALIPAAHAQEQLWIRQFGTTSIDIARALAPDGAGGVMVAGWTFGSVLLARHDGEGNQLWIRQFGTSGDDAASALVPDGAGGVMVAGWTFGSLGGPSAGGHFDAWLARYDSAGDRLWIRQFGTTEDEFVYALAPDGAGGVMVAGSTDCSLGGPIAGCTCAWPWNCPSDAFLARYDSAGNQLWIRQFGTNNTDYAYALAPDDAGGVIIAGTTGTLGGPGAGGNDVFLARYDSAGNQLWIRQFGTSRGDYPSGLASDGAGGVMVAGYTLGSLGGPNAGSIDAFLARYDSAGNRLWIRQLGTSGHDVAYGLAPDGVGGVMVAGATKGSLGGPHAGEADVFLARYEIDSCYANCDQSTGNEVLDIFDFLCWQNDFVTGNSYACDCDTSTGPLVCDMLDFVCFQNAFMAGCP